VYRVEGGKSGFIFRVEGCTKTLDWRWFYAIRSTTSSVENVGWDLTCDFLAEIGTFWETSGRRRLEPFWRVGRQLMSYMPIMDGDLNGSCYIYANPKFRATVFDGADVS
jgi:hypothetical protein